MASSTITLAVTGVQIVRWFTLLLGSVVLAAMIVELRAVVLKRLTYIIWFRTGSVLGVAFIDLELAARFNSPVITWRTPLALCVFTCLLIATSVRGSYPDHL